MAETGALDGLVCNAGFGIFGSVEETSLDRARAQMETNVFGTLNAIRAALPALRERRKGASSSWAPSRGARRFRSRPTTRHPRRPSRPSRWPSPGGRLVRHRGVARRARRHSHGFNEEMDWGGHDGSPYRDRLRSCEAVIRASLPKAPGPEVVARAVHRALTDRRPRVRYAVGPDSRLVPLGRRLFPDWLTLALIRDHFKV